MARGVFLAAVAALLAVALTPSAAHGQRATSGEGVGRQQPPRPATPGEVPSADHLPQFDPRRYTEDYLYLRDPAERRGAWWEGLKYVPLDRDEDVVLGLGGEARVRGEAYANALFDRSPRGDQAYVWERLLPYADLHVGPHLRAFAQIEAAYSQGQEPGPSPLDRTGVDLLQGFVELSAQLRGGRVSARIGRQVVSYGDGSLIDSRYGPNVLQAFDGAFANYTKGAWRADAFWARPVVGGLRDFDDATSDDQQIWGVVVGHDLARVERGVVDLAYIGFRNAPARFGSVPGIETRHSLALRHAGAAGPVDWKGEAIGQFGRFGGLDIRAYAVAAELGWTPQGVPLAPRLHVNGGIASGDRDPRDGRLGTFNALFPRGQYFSDTGLIGPYNLINLRAGSTVNIAPGLRIDGLAGFYWRHSVADGVYRNGGGPLFAAAQGTRRYVATQYEAVLDYSLTRGVDLRLTAALFTPGSFVRSTGPVALVRFLGVETRLWF